MYFVFPFPAILTSRFPVTSTTIRTHPDLSLCSLPFLILSSSLCFVLASLPYCQQCHPWKLVAISRILTATAGPARPPASQPAGSLSLSLSLSLAQAAVAVAQPELSPRSALGSRSAATDQFGVGLKAFVPVTTHTWSALINGYRAVTEGRKHRIFHLVKLCCNKILGT